MYSESQGWQQPIIPIESTVMMSMQPYTSFMHFHTLEFMLNHRTYSEVRDKRVWKASAGKALIWLLLR
jgi:hypothetical protein